MAESSWPYPDPDNSNKRIVTDAQFEQLYHQITTEGVFGSPSSPPVVYADDTGLQVKVRGDQLGALRGHGWATDSDGKTLAIGANASGSTRVDLAVLRLTRSTWQVTMEIRAGVPGSGAPSPVQDLDIGAGGVYEIPEAEVSVPSGATSILPAWVTPRGWWLGHDGQLLCTSAAGTWPPHDPGRRRWETDTGRGYESTGTTWLRVAEDAGPANLSLASGFTATEGGAVRRRNGWVFFAASLRRNKETAANDTVTAATVPAGYRPLEDIQTVGIGATGQQVVAVVIRANGQVTLSPGPVPIGANRSIIVAACSWPVA